MRLEILAVLLCTVVVTCARAQDAQRTVDADIYCSAMITKQPVPKDTYLITGEESSYQLVFDQGNYVYINRGAQQGVKKGDDFLVLRAVHDVAGINWYRWQNVLLYQLGTVWEDEGRLRVVVAQPNVSIARIEHSCGYMQRGDIVVPFAERPAPELKSGASFDRFAPPSGRQVGLVVAGTAFDVSLATSQLMYLNLGSRQDVRTGDYVRIFRYQGTQNETAYQTWREAFQVPYFGGVPLHWKWSNVPRQVLGEAVVLRVTPETSTALITYTVSEILAGDYVELE